ncbi:MAG: MATE family efflux transporter [Atopobiaceae bacterium]|jgi:putative MATE family efflux protein|nr:MATE family efflux transporter [Atopobiaceae bacterium]MCI2173458.1 MATE family efflux transporter [Atopobiaceae bacterium]MCI2207453.1 MATE family efflux transporter [Atopobiaceae bacterium]
MARQDSGAIDVTKGVIWRQLLALCVPIFFSSFFQQAYALINTFVVGQFAGKAALGGIQATMTLTDFAVGFCVGVGSGCAVISGQYFGAGDSKRLSESVHTAMALAIVGGVGFSLAGLVLIGPILTLMGTPEDLMGEALAYGRCYFGALLFSLVLNMGSALLRAVGDSRTPSVIVGITCVINVILDLVLVAGLHLEALGCGIATASSIAAGAAMTLYRLCHVDGAWRIDLRRIRIDGRIARLMLKTGLPLGIQSSVYSVSNIIAQSAVNSFGSDAVAGWGLSGRIDGIVWMISEALGVAVTTFSAQNFGARRYDRMRRSLHVSLGMTAVLVGGISAILFVFVEPISRFFIDDAGVTGNTVLMLRYIAPFYVCYSLSANISGAIRGSGESLRPMLLTILGTCVFRVIWLLAFVPSHHTLEMVLVSYPVTWILTGILFLVYYRHGHWLVHAREAEERVLDV